MFFSGSMPIGTMHIISQPHTMTTDASPKRSILHSGAGPFLWSLLFLAVFLGTYFLQDTTSIVINNPTIQEVFTKYGLLAGPALALAALLAMYLLAGIKRIIGLRRVRLLNPLLILAIMGPLLAFALQLQFREPKYTDIARGIIGYFALPLLLAAGIVCIVSILWLIVLLVRRP